MGYKKFRDLIVWQLSANGAECRSRIAEFVSAMTTLSHSFCRNSTERSVRLCWKTILKNILEVYIVEAGYGNG
jgi:hypothetical protein